MDDKRRVCPRCGVRFPAEVLFCPRDGSSMFDRGRTELATDPYIDLLIAGQFRIEQLIGIGAMGRVYRAHQAGMERPVAVKILHRELMQNPLVSSRFHREARVASRLQHPNVVQVLMVGELERAGPDVGGEAYLVMEYLDGISLSTALRAAGGTLPLERAVPIILQVCEAVGEAHAQGVIHRDLKPENVMLVRCGKIQDFVKVLDFGVAHLEWSETTAVTQAGLVFGTARYVSPEGARGEQVSPASDVYSIATLLFQCLAGRTPFDAPSPLAILLQQATAEPPNIRSLERSRETPDPIARLLVRNLSKNPADRCANAREFGQELCQAARDAGLVPVPILAPPLLVGEQPSATDIGTPGSASAPHLSPEAAVSSGAAPRPGPERTRLLESEPVPRPTRNGQPLQMERPGAAEPARPEVEPTLVDEAAPLPGSHSAPAGASMGPRLESADAPARRAAPVPSSEPRPARWFGRRLVPAAACFVIGVVVALVVALRLGVFRAEERGPRSYLERARAALRAGAYDQPPGENVKELTDLVLERWPNSEAALEIRQQAAAALVAQAELLELREPEQALRRLRLARQLDPQNPGAQHLVSSLEERQRRVPTPGVATGAPGSSANSPARPPASGRARRPLKPATSSPTPSASSAEPGPVPSSGGRWL